jgi:ABC-type transport system involved in multi-copper enzyme maturation permease subunit
VIGRIYAIALNTFREAIRNKVLYGVIVLAIGANLFALVLGQMSLHEEARVATDVGLAAVSLFGSITAIVLGVSLLYNEVKKRTIHTILAKPIHRFEFVLGKYGGMAFTLSLLVGVFTLFLWGLLFGVAVPVTALIHKAVLLAYLEVLVVAALAVFFSSFSSPYLSGTFTFGLFVLGRVSPEWRRAAEGAHSAWIRRPAQLGFSLVPDLDLFSISGGEFEGAHVSVHGDFVSWAYVGQAAVYAACVIAILLGLASLIFRWRDFV